MNQNQDADRNPESNFENNMSEPEISEVPSSDNVEQPTESPTWAEAELEDDDEGFVDVVDAPAHAESSLESEASQAIAEALKQEITALKTQLEDQESKYTRMYADFENFRKRTQKEREDMEQSVKCSTLTELLPVVDNFERARSQIKPQTDAEMNIHKSYQSVYKQLVDCLKRVGVSPMRAEGNPFDPALHEAVMREPTAEHPEGTVLEELMRGYMLGDRVIRHAMVKVAAEPEEQEGDPGQPPQAEEES
ncbi:MAG: nucleotide exchange factor GrpE [Leptolyngbyaceae bacterium]|nr:nucleotide exchange factor GrpE [Leptolyngbyaceae bacterium]